MRRLFIAALALLATTVAHGQTQLVPQTLASGGAEAVGATARLSYTIGQPFAASLANVSNTVQLTQGFQQPSEFTISLPRLAAVKPVAHPGELAVRLYPNPTSDRLTVETPPDAGVLTAVVTDLNGRQVLSEYLQPALGTAVLDLKPLPEGSYLLYLTDAATGAARGTHRVVKLR